MAAENQNKISNIDLAEEAQPDSSNPPSVNGTMELSEERKAEITNEIVKIQEEIETLKNALIRKEKQLNELRTTLGETRWTRLQNSQAVNRSKQALSGAGQKTSQAFKSFGAATATKWNELKESPKVQSASEKFWNATSAVKAKIVGDGSQNTAKDPPTAQIAEPTTTESKPM